MTATRRRWVRVGMNCYRMGRFTVKAVSAKSDCRGYALQWMCMERGVEIGRRAGKREAELIAEALLDSEAAA